MGFTEPPRHRDAGALLPHRFNLACEPFTWDGPIGGLLSVALSRGFPRVDSSTTLPCDVPTFLEDLAIPAAAWLAQVNLAPQTLLSKPTTRPSTLTSLLRIGSIVSFSGCNLM